MSKISLLEMGKTKKRNVRETIISILSKEFPLNIRKIYIKTKKGYNLDVSYQAVFKIIKDLVEDNIIEQHEKEYKLNIEWIKELENEIDVIKKNYGISINTSEESYQSRINIFVSDIGPKIKNYIGKDKACIISVSGGGRLFGLALFKNLLKEGLDINYLEIDLRIPDDNKNFIKKSDVENKKLIFVDSEIYSGITYRVVMEKINKIKKKFGIKDVKFVADKDIPGLADFSSSK